MEWQDDGIVLAARRHGESAAIVHLLTPAHGRHAGLVRGGAGHKARVLFQPGNLLRVTWRARLASHLGHFQVEAKRLVAGRLLTDGNRLAALGAAAALLDTGLPERDPHPALFEAMSELIEILLEGEAWREAYVRFELALLAELGFGLDLEACAVTGATEGLAFVSPVSGRAVTRAGAGDYAPRLLPLPRFLLEDAAADPQEISEGLRLTGAFLQRHLFDATDRELPPARDRLVDRLSRELI